MAIKRDHRLDTPRSYTKFVGRYFYWVVALQKNPTAIKLGREGLNGTALRFFLFFFLLLPLSLKTHQEVYLKMKLSTIVKMLVIFIFHTFCITFFNESKRQAHYRQIF